MAHGRRLKFAKTSASQGPLVYVIDPDGSSRQSLSLLLQNAGYEVKAFASTQEFLEMAPVLMAGCVLLLTSACPRRVAWHSQES